MTLISSHRNCWRHQLIDVWECPRTEKKFKDICKEIVSKHRHFDVTITVNCVHRLTFLLKFIDVISPVLYAQIISVYCRAPVLSIRLPTRHHLLQKSDNTRMCWRVKHRAYAIAGMEDEAYESDGNIAQQYSCKVRIWWTAYDSMTRITGTLHCAMRFLDRVKDGEKIG